MNDKLFTEIYRHFANELESIITRANQVATKSLYDKLAHLDDWLSNDFSMAVNLLEANQEWLASSISVEVLGALKGLQQHAESEDNPGESVPTLSGSIDALSLVSKDAFEDWLVVNTAIKSVEAELSYEILASCQILGVLVGEVFDEKSLPVGPSNILKIVKKKVDSLELPVAPQTLIYKAFSDVLSKELKDLYEQVEVLAKRESLEYKATVSKSAPSPKTARNNIPTPEAPVLLNDGVQSGANLNDDESAAMSVEERQIRTLNTLSRLSTSLSTGRTIGRGATAVSSQAASEPSAALSSVKYAPGHLASLISQFQGVNQTIDESANVISLRDWIENKFASDGVAMESISSQESELIDVTDRFFDVIVDKIGVTGILEKWLNKLKVTILKIVLNDESFFSNATHPARQMLNKLAQLASSDNAGNPRMEKMLDTYIDKVVSEYDENADTIQMALEQLNGLLDRKEKAYQRNSERIARTYEGKQKIAEARSRVVADLGELLNGKSVPQVLMALLDQAGWREYMALTLVREGQASSAYREAVNAIQQLMYWFDNEALEDDKWALELEMELEASTLYEMVSRELSIGGQAASVTVLKELEDCLFNGAEIGLVSVETYTWPFDSSEQDLAELQPVKANHSDMSHWHKSILSMKIGDWIEIYDREGKKRSLRLAWSGSESFRFVFVDNQGMKDEDVSLNDLVAMFKDNRASFVTDDQVPLVDQGLHQMVQSVYEELSSQSSCDALTGLLNRQAFERAIDQSVAGAISNQHDCVIFYVDLDKFNLTNTNYGHVAGDAVLKHVAEVVRNHSEEGAFCGRLGGNEFGLIMLDIDAERAMKIAESIRVAVEATPFNWDGHVISNTVSIGVVPLDIEMDNYDLVMRKAALACESAKSHGQNRCMLYTKQDKDQKKRDEMLQWIQRLDASLDDLLTLRCQEIRPNDQVKHTKSHWEILLGVKQDGQVLPPGMLIEAAEHFGRMAKVDKWVFHNVLNWMEANPNIVDGADGFSINLSGNSLSDEVFLEFVMGEFSARSIDPSKICFEITETAAIANLAAVTEFIRLMKARGCKFSLDDFGSGLSSYAYIQKLPVDFIKIDGIFVRNIVNNTNDQALVKSINELAHVMGMKTIAEYVENHEILGVLEGIGVDHSQGYGIKKPGLLSELA